MLMFASQVRTREEMGYETEKSLRSVTIIASNPSVTDNLFDSFKNAVKLIELETGDTEINDRPKDDF